MIRQLAASLLPPSLRISAPAVRNFRAILEGDINWSDPEVLKKYVGIRDHLMKEKATKDKLADRIGEVLEAVQQVPASSGYRQAVEATYAYRLKVLEQNATEAAVEEVLNAHMEELIDECNDEMKIIPMMAGEVRGARMLLVARAFSAGARLALFARQR